MHRRELTRLLQIELDRTAKFGEFETRQLRKNIKKTIGNAQTEALSTWLTMIREVKESNILLRRENRIRETRMQSITRFLNRATDA